MIKLLQIIRDFLFVDPIALKIRDFFFVYEEGFSQVNGRLQC